MLLVDWQDDEGPARNHYLVGAPRGARGQSLEPAASILARGRRRWRGGEPINPPERGKEYAPHDGHDQSSDAPKDDRARSTEQLAYCAGLKPTELVGGADKDVLDREDPDRASQVVSPRGQGWNG